MRLPDDRDRCHRLGGDESTGFLTVSGEFGVNLLRQLRVRPILAGILVDHISSFLVAFVYVLCRMALIGAMGGDVSPETVAALTPGEDVTMFLIGAMMTGLGAYVAARMAGQAHIAHGLAIGAAALLLAILSELFPSPQAPPLWMRLLGVSIVLPVGALGGHFARLHDEAAPTDEPSAPRRPLG